MKSNAPKKEYAVVEERLSAIDAEYSDPSIGSNTARLMELHNESAGLQKELDELYEHWDVSHGRRYNTMIQSKSAKNPHFKPLFIDKLLGMEYK